MSKKIAITLGDPNGIGPEVVIKALNKSKIRPDKILLVGNYNILDYYKDLTGLKLKKQYEIVEIPYEYKDVTPTVQSAAGGEFVYQSLKTACDLVKKGRVAAIATAPISKHSLNLANHRYSGQTEVLEDFLAHDEQHSEMMFLLKDFRVFLLTRHIALEEVPKQIKRDLIVEKINRANVVLKERFGIANPKIVLCSLNPHCGENGLLGDAEIKEFLPALMDLRSGNVRIEGPFPSDALFAAAAKDYLQRKKQKYDCYIACYHDQGLIPVKMLGQDDAVNMTVGLEIIRTSPAHGTAYDIAGKNIADAASMLNAIQKAYDYSGL